MKTKMGLNQSRLSQNKAAIAAAIALFANIVLAGTAYGGILPGIIVKGDSAAALNNIIAYEQQFRMAICLLTLNVIADIVVFWALYLFLKPVNRSVTFLACIFGAIHAAVARCQQ